MTFESVTVLVLMATVLLLQAKMPMGFLPPPGTCWLIFSYQPAMLSFELYLHNINLIVPLECAVHVVITLGVFGKASELV